MTAENSNPLLKTPLHDLHIELGARMVPFAGYTMPVQYPAGIMKEHLHTRNHAGLFDVSHMGQVKLFGENAATAFERLVPVDILGLEEMRQRYALFTNEQGGILDDLMVANAGDHLFVVVNAACKVSDIAHMQSKIGDQCKIEVLESHALLALQGPAAASVMAELAPASAGMVFMDATNLNLDGIDCFVTRSGYTGEDGFEISVAAEYADRLARRLLSFDQVEPVGLGARDSLRLESGLCLYGHDMNASTTPVEASLLWALSKPRRADGERAGGYPGAEIIHRQQAEGVSRKRVGLRPGSKAPIREGAELVDQHGKTVGKVTSGGFGPSVGGPVAMGYVESEFSKTDTQLFARVRSKLLPLSVAKMPFVTQNYYRGK